MKPVPYILYIYMYVYVDECLFQRGRGVTSRTSTITARRPLTVPGDGGTSPMGTGLMMSGPPTTRTSTSNIQSKFDAKKNYACTILTGLTGVSHTVEQYSCTCIRSHKLSG